MGPLLSKPLASCSIQFAATTSSGLWMSLKANDFGPIFFRGSCCAQLLSGYDEMSASITDFYSVDRFYLTLTLVGFSSDDVSVNNDGTELEIHWTKGYSPNGSVQLRFRPSNVEMKTLKVTKENSSILVEIPKIPDAMPKPNESEESDENDE